MIKIDGHFPTLLVTLFTKHVLKRDVLVLVGKRAFDKCLICRTFNCGKPTLTIGDPDIIKDILVTDFHVFTDKESDKFMHPIINKSLVLANGDDWKRLRSIVNPIFSTGNMKKIYELSPLKDGVEELDDNFCAMHHRDGIASVDMRDTISRLTMQVEGRGGIVGLAYFIECSFYRISRNF